MNIITRTLAVLALIGAVLGTCITHSTAAVQTPADCRYIGYTNAWTTTDGHEDLFELYATAGWYPMRHCTSNNGARVMHTAANTRLEVLELKDMFNDAQYDKRFDLPLVYCEIDRYNAYLMGERWLFSQTKITEFNKRRWNVFAHTWVRDNASCRLGN